jgi:hypothetical protein
VTVLANSYGTADGVAVRCGQYVDASTGLFTTSTHPTKAQVETFINQVSGLMNASLSKAGFSIPITQADAGQSVTGIIEEYAADLVLATGMQGRFYSAAFQDKGLNRIAVIAKEIEAWVVTSADGLENMGAARETDGGASSFQAGTISLDFVDHNETVY